MPRKPEKLFKWLLYFIVISFKTLNRCRVCAPRVAIRLWCTESIDVTSTVVCYIPNDRVFFFLSLSLSFSPFLQFFFLLFCGRFLMCVHKYSAAFMFLFSACATNSWCTIWCGVASRSSSTTSQRCNIFRPKLASLSDDHICIYKCVLSQAL